MKTVLITGANRGIGLGLSNYYLEEGWLVIAASRSTDGESLKALTRKVPDRCRLISLDVSDENSIASAAQQLQDVSLDLLINNAGVCVEENLGAWNKGAFERSFEVNTIGPALVAQAFVALMGDGAKLINLTSGMGSFGLKIGPENGLDAYAMSKVALNMLSLRLAEKVRDRGITVAAVNPGWVQTDMGGSEAPALVDDAVVEMAAAIRGITLAQSGGCFAADGSELPW